MSVTAHDPQSVLSAIEASDRFLIQQVFKPIANEYRISIPEPGSTEEGEPLLYVKQKKLKIKEDIRFRLSPDDGRHLFMIKSKTVFEFRGRHEVLDELDQRPLRDTRDRSALRRAALEHYLERHDCERIRHGRRHDVWRNRATGARSTLPRHGEIPRGTVHAICRDLGVDVPDSLS